jgi:hypothetical protein
VRPDRNGINYGFSRTGSLASKYDVVLQFSIMSPPTKMLQESYCLWFQVSVFRCQLNSSKLKAQRLMGKGL